eukprot:2928942-Pleurochrysis_carterae.AAC.1
MFRHRHRAAISPFVAKKAPLSAASKHVATGLRPRAGRLEACVCVQNTEFSCLMVPPTECGVAAGELYGSWTTITSRHYGGDLRRT